MNESIYGMTPDTFKRKFSESLRVHPCSYDPSQDLKETIGESPDKYRCYLPVDTKALLFYRYCEENGKQGKIYTSNYHMETFSTPEQGLIAFVTVTADVYIDDSLVGSSTAGQCCRIGDFSNPLDRVVQTAGGLAKARALSNAGFGIVDGTDLDPAVFFGTPDGNTPFPVPPVPFVEPVAGGNQQAVNNPPAAPVGYQPSPIVPAGYQPQTEQANLFQQLGGQNDPLTQAKTMLYPLPGYYQGKTLGSLTTRALEALASKATNDPSVEAAVRAARLILEDRNKANGKAK